MCTLLHKITDDLPLNSESIQKNTKLGKVISDTMQKNWSKGVIQLSELSSGFGGSPINQTHNIPYICAAMLFSDVPIMVQTVMKIVTTPAPPPAASFIHPAILQL